VKKNVPTVEPVSLGTRLAEKTRAAANTLSDKERERLLLKGMQLIYAGRRQKSPLVAIDSNAPTRMNWSLTDIKDFDYARLKLVLGAADAGTPLVASPFKIVAEFF